MDCHIWGAEWEHYWKFLLKLKKHRWAEGYPAVSLGRVASLNDCKHVLKLVFDTLCCGINYSFEFWTTICITCQLLITLPFRKVQKLNANLNVLTQMCLEIMGTIQCRSSSIKFRSRIWNGRWYTVTVRRQGDSVLIHLIDVVCWYTRHNAAVVSWHRLSARYVCIKSVLILTFDCTSLGHCIFR